MIADRATAGRALSLPLLSWSRLRPYDNNSSLIVTDTRAIFSRFRRSILHNYPVYRCTLPLSPRRNTFAFVIAVVADLMISLAVDEERRRVIRCIFYTSTTQHRTHNEFIIRIINQNKELSNYLDVPILT